MELDLSAKKKYLSNALKELLAERKVSQTTLGIGIGGNQSLVSKWLNCKTYPSEEYIKKLMNYFGVERKVFDLVYENADLNTTEQYIKKKYLSDNLRELMEQNGIDNSSLGASLGGNQSLVSKWINCETYPTEKYIIKLIDYFGVDRKVFDLVYADMGSVISEDYLKKKHFADGLKNILKENNMTLTLLELKIGIKETLMQKWLSCEGYPNDEEIAELVEYFNVERKVFDLELYEKSKIDLSILEIQLFSADKITKKDIMEQKGEILHVEKKISQNFLWY